MAAASDRRVFWPAVLTLWRREMVRFWREPNRVVSAVVTPLIFWIFLGAGLNELVKTPVQAAASGATSGAGASGGGYMAYFFVGMLTMILLFTAIFSTITVIEDRREGFLQAVMVAPVSRLAVVLGKVFGGATLATVQGAVLVVLWAVTAMFWPVVGQFPGWGAVALAVVVMFVLAMALTALGMCIAWPMDSTAGFHAIMMLVLMPMWFLSGAVFPLAKAPAWMQALMYLDPLTYGNSVLAETLQGAASPAALPISPAATVALMLVLSAGALWLAARIVAKPRG